MNGVWVVVRRGSMEWPQVFANEVDALRYYYAVIDQDLEHEVRFLEFQACELDYEERSGGCHPVAVDG